MLSSRSTQTTEKPNKIWNMITIILSVLCRIRLFKSFLYWPTVID